MEMRHFFSIILLIFFTLSKCQISMVVKKLSTDSYRDYVPDNVESKNYEYRYPGHILEITISNNSDKSISFPIDTISYALPYTDNVKKYYNGRANIINDGDLYNALSIYPFIYQNGSFKEVDMGTDPYFEEEQLIEIQNIKKIRTEKINKWKKEKNITDELFAIYNWYIMNHMVTILPNEKIKYKIYFNPFLKKLDEYSDRLFYSNLDYKVPYNATFKLILNKGLYKFLSKEDKKEYPNLFTGIVSTTPLIIE